MRRHYRPSKSSKKEFVNSYHLNEVPLPYYNPLQDPYLQGFFGNYHVSRILEDRGLIYKACWEYPYEERRLTNCNKFLRSNSVVIPAVNLKSARVGLSARSKSYSESEPQSPSSQQKLSESDIMAKSAGRFTDTSSRRHSLTRRNNFQPQGISFRSRAKKDAQVQEVIF